jgi:hypothetical protein
MIVSSILLDSASTILQTELHAIYNGLCLAIDRGFNNVVIESYSTIAIGLVEHDNSPLHPYASLIKKIKLFQKQQCANWLVKKDASSYVS